MDQNTKDVLMITVPLLGAIATSWVAYRVAALKLKIDAQAEALTKVGKDVLRVETATNGHTDRLAAAIKSAAIGEGRELERVERRGRDASAQIRPGRESTGNADPPVEP